MTDPYAFDGRNSFDAIEAMIRAARDFVRPSDDLRPRTLEAARIHRKDRRAEQQLGGFALAVLLLVSFSSPAIRYAGVLRAEASAPSSTEIQHRAAEFSSHPAIGHHWGLAEAFTQIRRVQAHQIGQSFRTIK